MKSSGCILLGFFVLCGILFQCARVGSPNGGPKDELPPQLVKAIPQQRNTNFNGNKILLYFDEYVTLKDIQKQLIISPPMKTFPEFIPSGGISKKIEIRIKDTLLPNTTYVLNFGNSIKDNNEGNTLGFFQYVFSTGANIDSLSVQGSIHDALKTQPDNFVSVMLYQYDSVYKDSIIYRKRPTYITNTLDSASTFTIPFVKAGKYKLVAMKDVANNYIFDPDKDKIGFVSQPIEVPSDSLYSITLFKEQPAYKVSRPTQLAENQIRFPFTGARDSLKINVISATAHNFRYTTNKDPEKDSLYFWFTPAVKDSISFTVTHMKQVDTFHLKIKEMKPEKLKIQLLNEEIAPGEKAILQSNIPLIDAQPEQIFIQKKDSTSVPFSVSKNGTTQRFLNFPVEYNQNYQIRLLPNAFTDFFGNTNDTLKLSLKSRSKESYSSLHLILHSDKITFPIILQITDLKGVKVIEEQFFDTPQNQYSFEHIIPGKYRLRIIEDSNRNRRWDTGNFLQQLQAEKVIYFPKELELRANWDVQEKFHY